MKPRRLRPAYIPSDDRDQPGLCWYLHYRRCTGDLSQINVMDHSDDQWLQDPVLKRSGEARPGESAPALIKRYRAGIVRHTEADPGRQVENNKYEGTLAVEQQGTQERWLPQESAGCPAP